MLKTAVLVIFCVETVIKNISGRFNEWKVLKKSIYLTSIFCNTINCFPLTFDKFNVYLLAK